MEKIYQKFKALLKKRIPSILIPLLISVFAFVWLSRQIIFNIFPGEAGVRWKRFEGGTDIDRIYAEGIHFIYPWDKMYIYNVRVQQTAHEFDVLTVNGMNIHLSISVRYYPQYDLLGLLHQKVGPNYVEIVVIPEIEAVLRVLIGRLRADEVYSTERAILEKSLNQAVEQIAQRFINVDDVIIKRIEFPAYVKQAIENKMEELQRAEAHQFRIEREEREAERRRIEAEGLKKYREIEAEGFKKYNETLASSLSDGILLWRSIQATLALARSANAKVVVIGSGEHGLPIFGNIPMEQFQNLSSVAPLNFQDPADINTEPEYPVTNENVSDITIEGAFSEDTRE